MQRYSVLQAPAPRKQLHLLQISPSSPPAHVTAGVTAPSRGRTGDHCQFSSCVEKLFIFTIKDLKHSAGIFVYYFHLSEYVPISS